MAPAFAATARARTICGNGQAVILIFEILYITIIVLFSIIHKVFMFFCLFMKNYSKIIFNVIFSNIIKNEKLTTNLAIILLGFLSDCSQTKLY